VTPPLVPHTASPLPPQSLPPSSEAPDLPSTPRTTIHAHTLQQAPPTQHLPQAGALLASDALAVPPQSQPPSSKACCEVSERAMHRSSPHGPCKPSARVTG
jgi:hypothetical protein